MTTRLRTVGIVLAALLLAMLLGIMVTRAGAEGPVIWKQFCPRWHELQYVPEKDGGVNVLCVLADMAEEAPGARE